MKSNGQLLQANWIHPPDVERWLRRMIIGPSLNVCSGMSLVGDIRIDIDPKSNRTAPGDLFKLGYPPQSFDTVICDAPFKYFNRFKWILKLSELARLRLMISSPNINIRLSKKNWKRTLYYSTGYGLFLRTYWVFDSKNNILK